LSVQAFIAAHTVLSVLEEKGAVLPSMTLTTAGICTLSLSYEDYTKHKELAEQLLNGADKWYTDSFGQVHLTSMHGLEP